MSVTSVDKDYDNPTTTLVADFDAPIDEVWQLWADPRKLERWWGPPTYPATFEKHDLAPGGRLAARLPRRAALCARSRPQSRASVRSPASDHATGYRDRSRATPLACAVRLRAFRLGRSADGYPLLAVALLRHVRNEARARSHGIGTEHRA